MPIAPKRIPYTGITEEARLMFRDNIARIPSYELETNTLRGAAMYGIVHRTYFKNRKWTQITEGNYKGVQFFVVIDNGMVVRVMPTINAQTMRGQRRNHVPSEKGMRERRKG